MTGSENLKPFKPGDERINRKGRPRKFDAIKELAKDIGDETVDLREDGAFMSRAEAILRDWFNSKNFQKQLAAMQYAYGKLPDKIEYSDERGIIIVEWEEGDTMDLLAEFDDDEAGFTTNPALPEGMQAVGHSVSLREGGLEAPPSSDEADELGDLES